MAEVRAYFRVSYKVCICLSSSPELKMSLLTLLQRVIDYIPMVIDKAFLFAVAEGVQSHLIQKLGLGTPQAAKRCELYLEEDASIVARRDELLRKKERLERVRSEVESFGIEDE